MNNNNSNSNADAWGHAMSRITRHVTRLNNLIAEGLTETEAMNALAFELMQEDYVAKYGVDGSMDGVENVAIDNVRIEQNRKAGK